MTHREAAIHHLEQALAHPSLGNLREHCRGALSELKAMQDDESHQEQARAAYLEIMGRSAAGKHSCDCPFAEVIRLIVGAEE